MVCAIGAVFGGVVLTVTAQDDEGGIEIDGGSLGLFNLHPYIDLRATWDDNVLLSDDDATVAKSDDVFFSALGGIQQDKGFGPVRLGLDAWFFVERYSDVDAVDDEDFGINLDIGSGGDKRLGERDDVELILIADFQQTDDIDYETGDLEDTETFEVGGGLGKSFGTRVDADVVYTHSEREYDSGLVFGFNEDSVRADVTPHVSDKTSLILVGVWGEQDSDATPGVDEFYELRGGLSYRATDKTRVSASVGYARHDRFDADTVSFEVSGAWQATDKLGLDIAVNNEYVPSVREDNLNLETHLSAVALYRVSDTVAARANVDWHGNALEVPSSLAPAGLDGDSDTVGGNLTLIYSPRDANYSLYAEARYETRDSEVVGDDYDKTTASVGARLRY